MVNTVWLVVLNRPLWAACVAAQIILGVWGHALPWFVRWFPGVVLGVFILAILAGVVLAGLGER